SAETRGLSATCAVAAPSWSPSNASFPPLAADGSALSLGANPSFFAGSAMHEYSQSDDNVDPTLKHNGPVQALLRVPASACYFCCSGGRLYAEVPLGLRREIHGLRSAAFRDWLSRCYWNDRHELPLGPALDRALEALEMVASFEHGTTSCFIRVGRE